MWWYWLLCKRKIYTRTVEILDIPYAMLFFLLFCHMNSLDRKSTYFNHDRLQYPHISFSLYQWYLWSQNLNSLLENIWRRLAQTKNDRAQYITIIFITYCLVHLRTAGEKERLIWKTNPLFTLKTTRYYFLICIHRKET